MRSSPALLPEFYVAEPVRRGKLVHVLREWSNALPVHAVFPSSRHIPAKVRALVDFISERLSSVTHRSSPTD
jgi:DNA-binding transcriptional LysR family regulator